MPFPNPYKQRKAFEQYVADHSPDTMSDSELSREIKAWGKFFGAPVPAGKLEKFENWAGWILIFGGFGLAFAAPPFGLGGAFAGLFLKGRDLKKENDRKAAKELAGKRLQAVAEENDKRTEDREQLLAAMAKPKHANGALIQPAPPPPAPEIPAAPVIEATKTTAPEEAPPPPIGKDPDLPGT